MEAVAAQIVEGPAGDLLLFCAALSADVAAFGELLLDLNQVLLVKSDIQGGRDGVQVVDLGLHLQRQLGEGLVGALQLVVPVKVFPGVFRGGEGGIQGDGDGLVGIVVQCFQGFVSRPGAVAVGVQQLAVDPVGIPFFGILDLPQLQVIFFHVALQGGLDDAAQVGGLLADAGDGAPFGIVVFQQGGHGIPGDGAVAGGFSLPPVRCIRLPAVQGQGQGAELHGLSRRVGDIGHKVFFADGVGHFRKGIVKCLPGRFVQGGGRQLRVRASPVAELLGQNGGDAGEAAVEGLEQGLGLCGQGFPEGGAVRAQCIQLVLGFSHEIRLAGQNLPEGADRRGDPLDAVDDDAVLAAEDNVAVFSHDLDHQRLASQVAHLVQMLDADVHDALQAGLGNVRDTPVLQVFSQQHTEAGGGHGAGLVVFRQIDQGQGGVRGEKEPFLSSGLFYGQQQLVLLRLGDLVQPPSHQFPFQFTYDIRYGNAVKSHNLFPPDWSVFGMP